MSRIGLPSVRTAAVKLALAVVVCSAAAALLARNASFSLYLYPAQIIGELALWQPVTWLPLESAPISVLFSALILWSIGGALEMSWGPRRFLSFTLGTAFASGLLTLALALPVISLRGIPFAGATVMTSAVWIAYGLMHGKGPVNFWGAQITGNVFAVIGLGFIALNAAFAGWQVVIPDAFAAGLTFLYIRQGSPRVLWLKFTSWRLQRELKARSRHLKVIADEKDTGPRGSDKYLH